MKLVIVESPAKAKTINKYLGDDFKVIASFGHVRDVPSKNGSVLPEEDFAIKYDIPDKAKQYVNEILKLAVKSDAIYLATDPDREGEAISWHVAEIIKEKHKKKTPAFKRIAFNEITKKAVSAALDNPRELDMNLVNAQQARRALDYLVGFNLSPLLWRKLPGSKSAGRVQSVALRLICEREEEIEKFKSEEYWDIILGMHGNSKQTFIARLTHIGDMKLEKFSITNEAQANEIVDALKTTDFIVDKLEKKQQKRNPPAPFITSSLQQEAARKLGFSAKKTMQVAQKLYEGIELDGENTGLITYMRTDGVTLAMEAVNEIRSLIQKNYGEQYVPNTLRTYKSKAKNAQEAHEAIRPTNINLLPESLRNKLDTDYYKLYDLIWKRTIACQMENVVIDIVTAYLNAEDNKFQARANGSTIVFDGFYKIYQEGRDDEKAEEDKTLPPLMVKEVLNTEYVKPLQHFTEPPPRYSEASLVKKLEELGIGRPSTYASILSVLQDRKYVVLDKKRFIPEERGRLVTVFLVGFFKKYVEYDFTASLETDLDVIAGGQLEWKKLLKDFWEGFHNNISLVMEKNITEVISYVEHSLENHLFGTPNDSGAVSKECPTCKVGNLSLKLGKYGAFLACNRYPDCNYKKTIANNSTTNDKAETTEENIVDTNKLIGKDEVSGLDIYLKKGPYGWYIQLGPDNIVIPEDAAVTTVEDDKKITKKNSKTKKSKPTKIKPKRVQLPASMSYNDINLEIALKLLSLPLKIGQHPVTKEDITISIGRFGPYLKHADKFTSIPKKYDFLNVKLDDAMQIIKAAEEKAKSKEMLPAKKTRKKAAGS